jgi:hypothetical protein
MEDEDEEQVSNEAYDKMKKMYTKREYRTNRSSWNRNQNQVVVSEKHQPVDTENIIFDVPEQYGLLTAEKKLETKRELGQNNRCAFERRVVNFKHKEQPEGVGFNLHDRAAREYFQKIEELFTDETLDVQPLRDAKEALLAALNVLPRKSKFLALRNFSCFSNEMCQVLEYEQAVENEALFDSNDALDAKIEEETTRLNELIMGLNYQLMQKRRNVGSEPAKKKQRTSINAQMADIKKDIFEAVENINALHHQRTLAGVVQAGDFEANRVKFYTFRNENHVGVYELFVQQAVNPGFNYTKFKTEKRCTGRGDTKGFGKEDYERRGTALKTAIADLQTDLMKKNFKKWNYFTCHYHGTEADKALYENKYFHLSSRVHDVLNTIQ